MDRPLLCRCLFIVTVAMLLPAGVRAEADDAKPGFSFVDKPKEYLDVLLDGKIVARYMYAYDKSTPQRLTETSKPYLHVFDSEGKLPITNGPAGQFPHHRGIFIGWMKIGLDGKSYDRWHMQGGEIVHQKFGGQTAGAEQASFTSLTQWNDNAGMAILEEERTMTIRRLAAPGRLLIDFTAKLTAPRGDITLDGDPEHAGIQFRPANEVVAKDTVYTFPKEGAVPTKDLDYPWVGGSFTLRGNRFSVVHLNHPDNPKNTRYSAYRDYGRFGAFPKASIKKGESLVLKYRFLIADGEMLPVETIQKSWDDFAGLKTPSPAPKTTVIKQGGK